jgi:RimJ/RimL family protein N-acetyltransferase
LTEVPDEAWESDDRVRRTVIMPAVLAERLAARAEQRGLSISDLLAEYAQGGLHGDPPGAPVPGPPAAAVAGVRFREAGPADAAGLLALKKALDRETGFMLLEPDERSEDADDVAAELSDVVNSVVIVADTAGQLAGYVEARGGRFRRNRITAYVVIGVLAAASGQGIGAGLLGELERWASAHGIHRLELTVMADNRRARRLYERVGFAVEGRRRECLLVRGQLVDELYMAKLLPPRPPEPRHVPPPGRAASFRPAG